MQIANRDFFNGKYLQRPAFRAAAILFILLAGCFLPFAAGNKTFLESSREAGSVMPDGAYYGRPTQRLYARTKDPGGIAWGLEPFLALIKNEYLHEKTLPIWNPYQAFGTPLAANMQSQAFHPVTVIFALLHSPRTYNWFILLRLFVAGFFAYLYMRLFVSFIPALAAGVTSMFAGYYMLYITMPHLSVEVLLPAALLAAEHLIRTPRFRSVTSFAVVIFFVLVGGMPESSLLLLALAYTYLFFRIATDNSLHEGMLNRLKCLSIATVAGICFSALLLLPFRQFMRYSYDIHQFSNTGSVTGSAHDTLSLSIFTYLFPFLFGPGWDNNLTNYAGLAGFFLMAVAITGLSWRGTAKDRTLSWLTCFFALAVAGIVCKRYGSPLVNWIGSLPLFNLIIYVKYEEALLSIAASMLCAIGLERLVYWKMPPLKQVAALALSFLMIPLALLLSKDLIAKEVAANNTSYSIVIWAVLLPTSLLVVLSLLLLIANSGQLAEKWGAVRQSHVLSCCVLIVLLCETVCSYIVPTYYIWTELPGVEADPFAGAPYIEKLKQLAGPNRVFAEGGVLFPDWASAFGLLDVRDLDAMYYRKYFPFVLSFFRLAHRQPDADELSNRFTGVGIYEFNDYLQQRLLQLSSAKYVVTMPGTLLGANGMIDDIMRQNKGRLTPGRENQISQQPLAIDGILRDSLEEHPPYDRLPFTIDVNGARETLQFSFGINPAAFPVCGDGAEFIVEAKSASGGISKLFSRFIDPRHDISLRHWIDGSVDLSPYLGQKVDLLLTTNGGPKGDNCADWAFWSNFHFPDPTSASLFNLAYHKEVNIYEYDHILPRAAIYYRANIRPNEEDALKALGSPDLDVFSTVVLSKPGLTNDQMQWFDNSGSAPAKPADEAKIVSYTSRSVVIKASLERRGLLVLNDSDFPGWASSVDGIPAKIVNANYIFRGVFLEPGSHVVTFVYKPWSVTLGAIISVASFSGFAAFGLLRMWKRRRVTGNHYPGGQAVAA